MTFAKKKKVVLSALLNMTLLLSLFTHYTIKFSAHGIQNKDGVAVYDGQGIFSALEFGGEFSWG